MRKTTTFSPWIAASAMLVVLAILTATVNAGETAPVAKPAEPIIVFSPDGTISVTVSANGPLTYSVSVDAQPILEPSALGLKLRESVTLGNDVELLSSSQETVDTMWENRLGKRREVHNLYRELRLMLRERAAKDRTFQVIFRVFDDGVAFRYVLLSQPGLRDFVTERELTQFTFPADHNCYAGDDGNKYHSSQEWEFRRRRLSEIVPESVVGLPVLVETPAAWVAIGEADLLDWSGMWIGGADVPSTTPAAAESAAAPTPESADTTNAVTLVAKLAPRKDGEGLVKAETPHQSSWRVLMIGREPGRLIESEIIRNLSTPSKIGDAEWVKPGMMAWDHWWTGDTIMDTATIKEYIQFAADMGWEYQLIDWQWYGKPDQEDADITRVIPELDMEEVRRFAAERGVRLWLWLHWTDVDRPLADAEHAYKKAFPLYEQWGIAGVKIDFMDRDDQEMVEWYEKIASAAAEHKLMVNFHGAFKPCGFERTYPNQVTREGILGNEYNKWSDRVTPEHRLMLPFTRYLEGPADFTPGGFRNRFPDNFQANVKPTQVQGTRANELALFVCYESPVTCVCDHPDHIRSRPGADFLKIVPTVWDETKVLRGVVGEELVMVRRSGDDWFLGAMTNREPRSIEVQLDFLGPGDWKMSWWKDAAEAGENGAESVVIEERVVSSADTLSLRLAPAGGSVATFERQ